MLLQTLKIHGRNPRRYHISQTHQEGFQWIWGEKYAAFNFGKWLCSEDPIFWISGKPGAGKSTLMRFLVESERTMDLLSRKSSATILVHYFFHELGESAEKSFGGLLHAIVHQIIIGLDDKSQAALSQLRQLVRPDLRLILTSKAALPEALLMKILQRFLAECRETLRLCLFIDGLDECRGDHRMQLDFLTDWARSSLNKKLSIKLCLAGRVEPETSLRLSKEPTLAIHQFMERDISSYVSAKLGQAWSVMARQSDGTTANFDQSLIDYVVNKAEGVFVWVTIVVSQLVVAIEEDADNDHLHKVLADVPEGLEMLYESVINKIDRKFWHDTINILRIFEETNNLADDSGVENPLDFSAALQDPASAITCKAVFDADFNKDDASLPRNQCAQTRRRLQRSCRGLIEFSLTEDYSCVTVTLLHRTVLEYVTKSPLLQKMLSEVDGNLLKDPAVALMAMQLRLMKTELDIPQDGPLIKTLDEDDDLPGHRFLVAVRAAERSTGSSQTLYIEEFDRMRSSIVELDRLRSLSHPEWTQSDHDRPRALMPEYEDLMAPPPAPCSYWTEDLFALTVRYDLSIYVHQQIESSGYEIIRKACKRPLLCNVLARLVYNSSAPKTCEILLKSGSDPNEPFGTGTVWSFITMACTESFMFAAVLEDYEKILKLMLGYGADPKQRVRFEAHSHWLEQWPMKTRFKKKLHSTTFHVILSYLRPWRESFGSIVKLLVENCDHLEAVDSDGVGVEEWADEVNPEAEAVACLRQEIALKMSSKKC